MFSNANINKDPYASEYYEYKLAVYGDLFTGTIYGAYIVVYIISVYVLLSKPGFTSSLLRMTMFGITTFMFSLGIIVIVLETTMKFRFFDNSNSGSSFIMIYKAWSTATCLMYILCDIICAWRTVILWNKNRRIIAVLGLFILGTIGAAGYALSFRSFGVVGDSFTSLGGMDLIVIVPTLSTNMLSTGLITWKAWQRRILVREHLCEGKGSVRVDRVFALLIESGLIYCCTWILYWISKSTGLPNPGFTVIAFYSGLYPTLIIILVSKMLSPVEHYSTHSTGKQFTHVPALGLPTDDDVPPYVPTTHRDTTSDCDARSVAEA